MSVLRALAVVPAPLPPKKPPASQYNWITNSFDCPPEQLDLPLPPLDEVVLPDDGTVTLLATENGCLQLLVAGFGLMLGKEERARGGEEGKAICAQVPFLRLQEVIVGSRGIGISSDLIEELCSRGIRVSMLTSSGKPYALLTSPMLTATVETRRSQLSAFHDTRGADFARWVVAGKLRNQEKLLRYFSRSREGERGRQLDKTATQLRDLRRKALATEGSSAAIAVRPALMGYEGSGARLYWNQVVGMLPVTLGFEGRVHAGPSDPVNAALNYGYGILYSHVWGAAMNAGLEPFAGFLLVDRSGKPSLVLDLVERVPPTDCGSCHPYLAE